MGKISLAASGLCNWINKILEFNECFLKVDPLKKEKDKLQVELDKANAIMEEANKKVEKLEATL